MLPQLPYYHVDPAYLMRSETWDPDAVPETLAPKKTVKNNVFSKMFGQNTFTIDPNILFY